MHAGTMRGLQEVRKSPLGERGLLPQAGSDNDAAVSVVEVEEIVFVSRSVRFLKGVCPMLEFIKVLLPIIIEMLPVIIKLFDKSKSEQLQYWTDLKNAAIAARDTRTAFWAGSMLCAVEGMSEGEYTAWCSNVKGTLVSSHTSFKAVQKSLAA
jgi:hypothetical protein